MQSAASATRQIPQSSYAIRPRSKTCPVPMGPQRLRPSSAAEVVPEMDSCDSSCARRRPQRWCRRWTAPAEGATRVAPVAGRRDGTGDGQPRPRVRLELRLQRGWGATGLLHCLTGPAVERADAVPSTSSTNAQTLGSTSSDEFKQGALSRLTAPTVEGTDAQFLHERADAGLHVFRRIQIGSSRPRGRGHRRYTLDGRAYYDPFLHERADAGWA